MTRHIRFILTALAIAVFAPMSNAAMAQSCAWQMAGDCDQVAARQRQELHYSN